MRAPAAAAPEVKALAFALLLVLVAAARPAGAGLVTYSGCGGPLKSQRGNCPSGYHQCQDMGNNGCPLFQGRWKCCKAETLECPKDHWLDETHKPNTNTDNTCVKSRTCGAGTKSVDATRTSRARVSALALRSTRAHAHATTPRPRDRATRLLRRPAAAAARPPRQPTPPQLRPPPPHQPPWLGAKVLTPRTGAPPPRPGQVRVLEDKGRLVRLVQRPLDTDVPRHVQPPLRRVQTLDHVQARAV